MFHNVKSALHRSKDTLLGDLCGGAALMVTLVAGLYLPGLF